MESQLTARLDTLTLKIEELAAQRDTAIAEKKKAQELADDLKREVASLREDLHQKELDIEFLTLSHKLADTPQKLADARVTVRRILHRVEKAISLLKQDARI